METTVIRRGFVYRWSRGEWVLEGFHLTAGNLRSLRKTYCFQDMVGPLLLVKVPPAAPESDATTKVEAARNTKKDEILGE